MKNLVILILLFCLVAPAAQGASDNFGRPYQLGLAWSCNAGASQWIGLRFFQLRDGLPGIWLEGKTTRWDGSYEGHDWDTGNGGINVQLRDGMYLIAGAGISVLSGVDEKDTGANFQFGLLVASERACAILS